MKDLVKRISISLALAVGEFALALLLLIEPRGFTAAVIVVFGVTLIVTGIASIIGYIRLPREEALKTWKLAAGTAGICAGITAIVNRSWLVELFGALSMLYGTLVIASAFLKLQMTVDALRGKRKYWYLMAISFVCSTVIATLLFINPFASESAAWIFMGVSLIITAALDVIYFVLRKQESK